MGYPIWVSVLIWIALMLIALTVLNIMFARNVGVYTNLRKRGMVRVKIRYEQGNKKLLVKGWSYKVELDSISSNPVSHSSSFVKVYTRGKAETVLAFSSIKKLDVLDDNYFSIVFAKRSYL